jgi:hypothetical protein
MSNQKICLQTTMQQVLYSKATPHQCHASIAITSCHKSGRQPAEFPNTHQVAASSRMRTARHCPGLPCLLHAAPTPQAGCVPCTPAQKAQQQETDVSTTTFAVDMHQRDNLYILYGMKASISAQKQLHIHKLSDLLPRTLNKISGRMSSSSSSAPGAPPTASPPAQQQGNTRISTTTICCPALT